MTKINLATLFSGIGAPEQGAIRVYDRVDTVFACEYDKFARQSYEANYHIDPLHFHKDINDLDATQYRGKVDILVGGSPCQSFSISGLRHGTEDERGQLIYQYIRVVEECRPPIIIYENVRGILNIDNGRTIKEFIQALRDIGYHCHNDVLNTKNYGVPQNRERLFIVGFLDVNFYHRFNFSDSIPLDKRLKDILEDEVDKKYYLSQKLLDGFKLHSSRHLDKGNGFKFAPSIGEGTAVCISTKAGSRTTDNYIMVPSATACGYEVAHDGDSINLSMPKSKTRRGRCGDAVAQTLDTQCNQGVLFMKGRCWWVRKLTPRECFRLQDFPDTFRIIVSDSQAYKQAGNSMSVNILEMIFSQVEKAKAGVVPDDRLF